MYVSYKATTVRNSAGRFYPVIVHDHEGYERRFWPSVDYENEEDAYRAAREALTHCLSQGGVLSPIWNWQSSK